MRTELGPKGIQVLTVNPGVMGTGSHIPAKFSGNSERENSWFAAAATLPGKAVEASVAAKRVINSLLRDSVEPSIGLQALIASHLSNPAPEPTPVPLSLANSLLRSLPAAPGNGLPKEGATAEGHNVAAVAGVRLRQNLPKLLKRFGEDGIQPYNQNPDALSD